MINLKKCDGKKNCSLIRNLMLIAKDLEQWNQFQIFCLKYDVDLGSQEVIFDQTTRDERKYIFLENGLYRREIPVSKWGLWEGVILMSDERKLKELVWDFI